MTPDWQQVQDIFHKALDLPASQREAFLSSACGADASLAEEVRSLLAFESDPNAFGAAIEEVAHALTAEPPSRAGERLGAYRLIREIGRGGMGTVYLAERADAQFDKQVAIKIVRRGMDTEDVLARFRWERQILANLVNANIAQLYDGGATGDGLPYLVMEYVEGVTITSYCASRKLPTRARLQLFLDVCEGVAHAHRNLIVHRDLKPANILVTAAGQVKLLDFGIAKLLDPQMASVTHAQHTVAGRMFTPEYASPEQVNGTAAGTSTDIYSLGVVLFEMLTDARPHRLATYTEGELHRVICEQESPRASSLAQGLSHELDAIVAMALRKEPERRYRSVEEFAADLRRYLTGFPVLAKGDSLAYRTGRFIRRHRVGVASGALAVASLLAGLGIALYQANVAHQNAARAERRFAQLRELANSVIFDHYERIRGLPGSTAARYALVQTALKYLDSLYAEAGDDDALKVELARAYERIGDVQGLPGQGNRNQPHEASSSYRKASQLLESVLQRQPDDAGALAALIRLNPRWTSVLRELNASPAELIAMARHRVSLAERLAKLKPGSPTTYRALANAQAHLGQTLQEGADAAGALAACDRSLETVRQWAGKDTTEPSQATRASVTSTCNMVAMRLGRLEQALAGFRQLVAQEEALIKIKPNYTHYQRMLYLGHWYAGYTLASGAPEPHLGRAAEAVAELRTSLALVQQLAAAAGQQETTFRRDVAMVHESLGKALLQVDAAEGLRHLQKAVAIFQELAGAMQVKRADFSLAWAQASLGAAFQTLKRNREALAYFEKAHAATTELLQAPGEQYENHLGYGYLLRDLAVAKASQDPHSARQLMHQAVQTLETLRNRSNQPRVQAALAAVYESRATLESMPQARCAAIGQSLALWAGLANAGSFTEAATSAKQRLAPAAAACRL